MWQARIVHYHPALSPRWSQNTAGAPRRRCERAQRDLCLYMPEKLLSRTLWEEKVGVSDEKNS